jgi:PAS domain S-box-containing protein
MVNARRIAATELLLVAFDDVTESERARDAAKRAALELRDVLVDAAEGVLMVNVDGRIAFVNRAAARIFRYERDELEGLGVSQLIPAGLAPGVAGSAREAVGRRKDGTAFPLEVSLSTGARGDSVFAFLSDVTERREAERAIQAYQGQLQRMAFDAAVTEERERRRIAIELHDGIGQDLAMAKMKLSAMQSSLPPEASGVVGVALSLIENAIDHSRTLVFDLSPPLLYDLGLEAALEWLAEDLEKRHGMKIHVDDDGAPKPLDDAAKGVVFRGVRELLMNVLKHAHTREASVTLRRTGDRCVVEVRDRGAGFHPMATERSSGGFGLLSVREQISRLGGTLTVSSAPGEGTRVGIDLPLKDGSTPPPPASSSPSPSKST